MNIVESPSFNVNFKNILFNENTNKDTNIKENHKNSNGIMQKQSKLLSNNKEDKSKK